MKLQIHLQVFITATSEKPCYERIVHIDGDFDYQSIVNSMFVLYGKTCVVTFNICQ